MQQSIVASAISLVEKMKDFKKLIVWQKSIDLFMQIDKLVKQLPREERFELSSQVRRAALSISSNIAEGSAYSSSAQYRIYLERSLGSAYEVETLLIALSKSYDRFSIELDTCFQLVQEVQKMLSSFIFKIKSS